MEIVLKYFPDLTDEQMRQLEQLGSLYREWNDLINVISRKDIDHLYERHVLHSLAITKIIEFRAGTKLLDVGTGGGFPGLPLAILFPNCEFKLIDTIGKKIKVVQELKEALSLSNLNAEKMNAQNEKAKYDFVLSRAVAKTEKLYKWSAQSIGEKDQNSYPNGFFLWKGGELQEELSSFPSAQIWDLKKWFEEDFFETKKIVYLPK